VAQKSFLNYSDTVSDDLFDINDEKGPTKSTSMNPSCTDINRKSKESQLMQNFKETEQNKILESLQSSKHVKGFEKSFYQPVITEVSKQNGQLAEYSLLSFIKIIYEINTDPAMKK
jgi:hypothetical protein